MMNILLVEDEPPILREIKYVIESFKEDYCVLATASDGQHAIQLIEQYGTAIDYMLVDIHIPVINGLEVIAYAKKQYPSILCSILTGYSDFNYAKQAIRLNVSDYLLKPLNEEELRQHLKTAYEKRCLDGIKNPVSYSFSESAAPTLLSNETHYRLLVLCIGSFPFYTTFENEAFLPLWKSFNLEQILNDNPQISNRYWIINGQTSSEKYLLLTVPNASGDSMNSFAEDLYQSLRICQYPVTMVADKEPVLLPTISSSMKKLRHYLSNHIVLGTSQLLFTDLTETDRIHYDYDEISSFLPRLQTLFQASGIQLFYAELQNYLTLMNEQRLSQKALTQYLSLLINSCISTKTEIRSLQLIDVNELVNDTIYLSYSYESLYRNLLSIFDDLLKSILNEADNVTNKQSMLLKIDAFIKEHHTEPINTRMIADHFGFTPAYLSKIYRDYKQISPSESIIRLRMEKAMELLQCHPELVIKDISLFVGYEDSLYFSKVFKKYTGLSPKKFQFLHSKDVSPYN